MITNKATITLWNDDRGYGFASANGVKYFVHIKALGRPIRSPRVGDTIIISSFGKTEKGVRIEKGELEGVPTRVELYSTQPVREIKSYRPTSFRDVMFVICIIVAAISGVYSFAEKHGFFSKGSALATYTQSAQSVSYTTRDEVAKFICENGFLPPNYVSKSEGVRLYESKTGKTFTKWNFNPLTTLGVMVGGDYFQNRDARLPPGDYREADVDYFGANRGTKRLVYTSSCNIYYTSDHYRSFTRMSF